MTGLIQERDRRIAAEPDRPVARAAPTIVSPPRVGAARQQRLEEVGLVVAQVLLTNDCLTDRRRYVAASQALGALLEADVIPIVNENDTVSVDEIVVGDNDNLAAMTAALIDADLLALLTDVPGVMTGDPTRDGAAQLIREAESADELRRYCFAKKAGVSTGGMITKLEAAERAGHFGIPTVIASGTDEEVLAAPYEVMKNWQRFYGGNLLVVLPDTFGTASFLSHAPDWVADWTGFRPDSR